MRIPGSKIAGGGLILIGFIWLLSLFLNPKTLLNRSANQIDGQQQAAGTQRFNTADQQTPLQQMNNSQVDQSEAKDITDGNGQPVQQAPQTLPPGQEAPQPQTTASPTPSPEPQFETTPQSQPTPQQTVVPEPVRAGW